MLGGVCLANSLLRATRCLRRPTPEPVALVQ
jgi:hypothetical protein